MEGIIILFLIFNNQTLKIFVFLIITEYDHFDKNNFLDSCANSMDQNNLNLILLNFNKNISYINDFVVLLLQYKASYATMNILRMNKYQEILLVSKKLFV
jgi:hypothetical protein